MMDISNREIYAMQQHSEQGDQTGLLTRWKNLLIRNKNGLEHYNIETISTFHSQQYRG